MLGLMDDGCAFCFGFGSVMTHEKHAVFIVFLSSLHRVMNANFGLWLLMARPRESPLQ